MWGDILNQYPTPIVAHFFVYNHHLVSAILPYYFIEYRSGNSKLCDVTPNCPATSIRRSSPGLSVFIDTVKLSLLIPPSFSLIGSCPVVYPAA